jgi:hypothetical protein
VSARLPTICALAVFGYGAALALLSPSGFPSAVSTDRRLPYISDKPLGEDGFYMLTVAWNLGHGAGFTYTGGRTTTGVQPLTTIADAAVASAVPRTEAGRWIFARAILLLGVVELMVFAAVIRRVTAAIFPDAPDAATLAFLLAIADYSLFRAFTYGLETGVYLILVACCVLATLGDERRTGRFGAVAFGALAGVTILARIDFAVVLAVVLGLSILSRRATVGDAVIAGLAAATVSAPWFLWVHSVSGHWMPSSGRAEGALIVAGGALARVAAMADAVAQQLSPWLYLELLRAGARGVMASTGATVIAWAIAAAVCAVALRLVWELAPEARARAWSALWMWTAAFALLMAVYIVAFDSTHFYQRYAAPLAVVAIPVLARALSPLAPRLGGLRVYAAALVAAFAITAAVTLHAGRIGNSHALSAGFVAHELPRTARIGAFQSGVIGYFNDNVVNLDGKVNAEALAGNGGVARYIDRAGLEYLIDWPGMIAAQVDRRWLEETWAPCDDKVPGGISVCLARRRVN